MNMTRCIQYENVRMSNPRKSIGGENSTFLPDQGSLRAPSWNRWGRTHAKDQRSRSRANGSVRHVRRVLTEEQTYQAHYLPINFCDAKRSILIH